MTYRSVLAAVLAAACFGCGNGGANDSINDALCTQAAQFAASCGNKDVPVFGDECHTDPHANCMAGCVSSLSCAEAPGEGTCSETCYCAGQSEGCYTPLVLSFDAAPVRFARGGGAFDLGIGRSVATDWPTSATPWLALDRNGNGAIDDGSELFGSATPLRAGGRARDGFAALRELDSNDDGWLTAADDAWPRLLLWTDRDGDHASSAGELITLSGAGIVAVDLAGKRAPRCDERGNCEGERSRFVFRTPDGAERAGEIIDVYLPFQHD